MYLGVCVNAIISLFWIGITLRSWNASDWYRRVVNVLGITLGCAAVAFSLFYRTATWQMDLTLIALLAINSIPRTGDPSGTKTTVRGVAAGVAGTIYIITAAAIPVLWVQGHLPPQQWWLAGFAFEAFVFAASAALFVWWSVVRSTRERAINSSFDRFRLAAFLVLILMVPLTAFVIIPALCFGLLPTKGADLTSLCISMLLALTAASVWSWHRRYGRSRGSAMERYAAARGLALDRVGESSDSEARAGNNHPE